MNEKNSYVSTNRYHLMHDVSLNSALKFISYLE
jgi:hypothetical protein